MDFFVDVSLHVLREEQELNKNKHLGIVGLRRTVPVYSP